MNLAQYVAYFRDHAAWLPPKDRPIGELVVKASETLDDILQQRGRGMRQVDREDQLQTALRVLTEEVRKSQAGGLERDAAWEKKALNRVSNVLALQAQHRSEEMAQLRKTDKPEEGEGA